MIGKCIASVKSHGGNYTLYKIEFKSEKHFSNWYDSVSKYAKVIGVFEDTNTNN